MCVLYQDVKGLLLTKKSLRGLGLDQDFMKLNLYQDVMHPLTDQNWRGAEARPGFQVAVIDLLELERVWAEPRCTRVLHILQLTYQRRWRWGLDQDVRGLQLHHSLLPGPDNGALIAVVLAALRRAGRLLRQCKQWLLVSCTQVGDQVSVLLLLMRYRRLCLTTTFILVPTGL